MATSIHNNSSSQAALLWIITEFKGSQCILDFASRRNCLFHRHNRRILQNPGLLSFLACSKCYWTAQIFFLFPCETHFSRKSLMYQRSGGLFSHDSGNDTRWSSYSSRWQSLNQAILQVLTGPPKQETAHAHLQQVHWAAPLELAEHPAGEDGCTAPREWPHTIKPKNFFWALLLWTE